MWPPLAKRMLMETYALAIFGKELDLKFTLEDTERPGPARGRGSQNRYFAEWSALLKWAAVRRRNLPAGSKEENKKSRTP
jgi:hypothetical protein